MRRANRCRSPEIAFIPLEGFTQVQTLCIKAQAGLSSRALLMMHLIKVFFQFGRCTSDAYLLNRHCSTALCKQCTAICSFDLCRSHYRNAQLVFSNFQPGWVFGSSSCCVYLCHEYGAVSMPYISCAVQQRQHPSACTANAVK